MYTSYEELIDHEGMKSWQWAVRRSWSSGRIKVVGCGDDLRERVLNWNRWLRERERERELWAEVVGCNSELSWRGAVWRDCRTKWHNRTREDVVVRVCFLFCEIVNLGIEIVGYNGETWYGAEDDWRLLGFEFGIGDQLIEFGALFVFVKLFWLLSSCWCMCSLLCLFSPIFMRLTRSVSQFCSG